MEGQSASTPAPVQPGSLLPARFGPSRGVRPSGGNRLVALGTTASAGFCPLTTPIAGRRARSRLRTVLGGQISLSKDVNSACATGPFTSAVEHGALLRETPLGSDLWILDLAPNGRGCASDPLFVDLSPLKALHRSTHRPGVPPAYDPQLCFESDQREIVRAIVISHALKRSDG